jgi:ribonucleotide reductase alpha subunit
MVMQTEMGILARTIMENKNYAHKLNGRHEVWPEVATRTAYSVVGPYLPDLTDRIRQLIEERKFVPGGRYLYASGRDYPQVNSCFLFRAADSRDGPRGWADTVGKATNALMTGGGIGVVYSDLREEGAYIKGLGGCSTGPLALMKMINECGRYVRQGGSRRSAIWAGLRWNHPDIFKFIHMKDWDEVTLEGKRRDFSFPAPMDTTNVSVILDDLFFTAYNDRTHPLYNLACDVYWAAVRHMLQTGEPGFSVDVGPHSGENLRNACLAGDTLVAVADGRGVVAIKDLVGQSTPVYSCDRAGSLAVGALRNVRVTRRDAEILKVTFDDHTYLRVTPDHLVMLASGSYVAAGNLKAGQLVMSFTGGASPSLGERRAVASVAGGGREDVYDGTVDGLHCFAVVNGGGFGVGPSGVVVHNCTEVTSADDNDMCNLSAVNMARIETKEEFHEVLGLVVPFLLCGSLYSKLPVQDMYRVREKNRRIGVGLMGVHEWLLKRGHRYGRCDELAEWMQVYSTTGIIANYWADKLSISRPVATRSIAPTGTISIVAETTSGIEPIMAVAYKRRYLDGSEWKAQCVVDPTAKRLIDQGVDPELIEDSLTLAEDVERRMSFQSWLQAHVDHGISSTINLPPWGSTLNNEGTVTSFGNTLLKYLPTLRGITAYPDGARMGQPITRMPYHEAISRAGVVFLDGSDEQCPTGVCGI